MKINARKIYLRSYDEEFGEKCEKLLTSPL
jgi:hypothetical protein